MNIAKLPIMAVVIIIGIGIAMLLMLIALKRITALSSAKSKARRFDRTLEQYRERYQVLETHAIDYSTALAARKDNLMVELHSTIQELEKRISTVMDLVDAKDPSALKLANKLFTDTITPPLEAAKGSRELVKWQDYLEKLIQAVGEAIYNASQHSRDIGLSGRGNRDTLVSLKQAGIDLQELRQSMEDDDR